MAMRIGLGHDTHRLVAGRPLILGGVRVEHPRGLAGHSDADVVLHAVTDALLGAAGLGDIGDAYPDTDPAYQDRDSRFFLHDTIERLKRNGWKVVNLDVIVFAEELIGVDWSAVNIKAKTGEGVDAVGKKEAISCQAVALIDQ
jgi:2-C-methyl-D-erythritol 2,4-cyclodiphosphate synthase